MCYIKHSSHAHELKKKSFLITIEEKEFSKSEPEIQSLLTILE